MTTSFDARPLTDPVDRQKVAAHARENQTMTTAAQVIRWVLGVMAIAGMAGFALTLATAFMRHGMALLALFVAIVACTVIALAIWWVFRWHAAARIRSYRLSQFAAANHMQYFHSISNPPLPGMIFNHGDARVANQVVRGTHPRFVEFGNYQYSTGSGKNRTTHNWGYVAIKLDVPLPNIVLDATGNNSFLGSNLPSQFSKDQRLALEGDFNQHFALYCPAGYERDALYLFTPDIMARFVDNAAQLDVEIVDDWLFFYTSRQASTLDAATWAWLFGAVGALMTKFDQWARWRDERLTGAPAFGAHSAAPGTHSLPFATPAGTLTPPPGVALQGRRLKKSFPWVVVVVVVVFVVLNVLIRFI